MGQHITGPQEYLSTFTWKGIHLSYIQQVPAFYARWFTVAIICMEINHIALVKYPFRAEQRAQDMRNTKHECQSVKCVFGFKNLLL
jgi:hypothetical protein